MVEEEEKMKRTKLIILAMMMASIGLILTLSGIIPGNAYAYYSPTGNLYSLGSYGTSLGLYGMYGGLYGLYGMGGIGGIYNLLLMNQLLGGQTLLSTPSITGTPAVTPTEPTATLAALTPLLPIFFGEQVAGTWFGTWTRTISGSLPVTNITTGELTLNLIEDLNTGTITAQAVFGLHPILGAGVDLVGFIDNNLIIITGIASAWFSIQPLELTMTCTALTPTEITGTYQLIFNNTIFDMGTFQLSLLPPLII